MAKQLRRGDFLDAIFYCPYDIQELVTADYLFQALGELSEDHREILFLSAVQAYPSLLVGAIRGQSDRNIRKIRATIRKKIHKKIVPVLQLRQRQGLALTREERQLLRAVEHTILDAEPQNTYTDS